MLVTAGAAHMDGSAGVQLALIEWLILSRTDLVLNPYFSSFAEEAAMVNLVPHVMVRRLRCARGRLPDLPAGGGASAAPHPACAHSCCPHSRIRSGSTAT